MEAERDLVEHAKRDPDAFGRLFDKYHDDVYRFILHRTANVALAQDLTSDTFHKVLKKLWMFHWRNVPFSAWLFRIASNEVNGYYRKHKRYRALPLEHAADQVESSLRADREIQKAEEEMARNKLFQELHRAIAQLSTRYQEVLVLRFFEGKKIKDIAEILNKSEGTIKSLLHRALKKLNTMIDSTHFGGDSI